MEGRRKGNISARSESYRARRKTTDPILPTLAVERTQAEAGTHTLTRAAYQKPNAAQSLPRPTSRPLARVGPTSAEKSSGRQEVADEKPFRYTTAGYPLSRRRQAMGTQRHRLWYSGVEQPPRGSSGGSVARSAFLTCPRRYRMPLRMGPEEWLPEDPTHTYSSSDVTV